MSYGVEHTLAILGKGSRALILHNVFFGKDSGFVKGGRGNGSAHIKVAGFLLRFPNLTSPTNSHVGALSSAVLVVVVVVERFLLLSAS